MKEDEKEGTEMELPMFCKGGQTAAGTAKKKKRKTKQQQRGFLIGEEVLYFFTFLPLCIENYGTFYQHFGSKIF